MAEHEPRDVVQILTENRRDFLRFLERRVGDPVAAEDILQEAFVRGVDKVESIRDTDSAVAWFYRTLRNAVIDHRRRRGAAGRALSAFASELESSEAPPDEVAGAICTCVSRIAGTLKPEYADALQAIDVEGRSIKEFAGERGITSGNAGVRVFRAREALRRRVMDSCGACAEHGCNPCTCG